MIRTKIIRTKIVSKEIRNSIKKGAVDKMRKHFATAPNGLIPYSAVKGRSAILRARLIASVT